MKQVVAKAGRVEIVEVPRPLCPSGGLLVRTTYSVISTGTESWSIGSTEPLGTSELARNPNLANKAYRLSREVLRQEGVMGLRDYVDSVRHPEIPLGYSSSGVVIEVGREVTDIVVGQRVACAGEGKASHSEYQAVPRKLAGRVPEGLSMRDAAFTTIGAIAMHAVRIAGLQLGERVGVVGAGLVGNLVAQLAKASGCRVMVIDLKDERLELARSSGAHLAVNANDPALASRVMEFTSGMGLDQVFVCAASDRSDPINTAAKICRNRGRVVVVGRVGMEIERKEFYQKELSLLMTRSLGPGRYDPTYEEKGVDYPVEYVRWTLNRNMEAFMDALSSGSVRVDFLARGEYPLARASEAYASLESSTRMTTLLKYEDSISNEPLRPPVIVASRKAGTIAVALVGPGAFAKETMIPLLRSSSSYNLRWLVSSSPLHAKQLERRYRFAASTCDYRTVLSDDEVDLVVIAAPNNLHCEMLASAMDAGKMALVEKPLCVTREEFKSIQSAQSKSRLPVLVGFNRRYAPLVLKMKSRMKSMDGPFVINYRVNAGFVPANRWSQDPRIGGGRIIHECCHFFDLFNFLLGPGDPKVSVEIAGITGANSVAPDNVSVALRYPNGSLANLLYVALGSKAMDRERIEVYAAGSSMVLDDFTELSVYGVKRESFRLARADKGHAEELVQVARLFHGLESSAITTKEVYEATELTFKVDGVARGMVSGS